MAKHPGFTAVAVLSLAMGIGANSTIFSIVDGTFLRPWPVEDPGSLVSISTATGKEPADAASYPEYLDLAKQNTVFSGVLAYGKRGAFVSAAGQGELALTDVVSENYFSVLGLKPMRGRTFPEGADPSAEPPGVVISYALWQRRFSGDAGVVGKPITLDGKSLPLLGVAPREFRGLERMAPTDVWVTPKGWTFMVSGGVGEFQGRNGRWLELVARVRPGVKIEQVRAQLDTIASRLAQSYPASNQGRRFGAVPESERMRQALRPALFLMAMVTLVLLIACGNVAGLLLVQNEQRRREIGIRLALGAGRLRLMAQLLTESGLLALVGGTLGIALSWWLISAAPGLVPHSPVPLGPDIRLDGRVLAFTTVMVLLTALVVGIVPALQATQCDLVPILKGEAVEIGRGTRGLTLRKALVVGEIALSVMLVTGAALLLRSLLYTLNINPGFDPGKNVVILTMAPPELYGYNQRQGAALYQSLMERLQAIPGVKRASFARRPLLVDDEGGETQKVTVPGEHWGAGESTVNIRYNILSPDYLATMGTHTLRGRGFERGDGPESARVVLINQTLSRQFWPQGDAVGKWLQIGKEQFQVVGVVEDGKYNTIHEAVQPYLFFPFSQMFSDEASLFVETQGNPRGVMGAIMREARSVNESVPIVDAITLKQHMGSVLFEDTAAAWLVGSLGLLGIFLASVGLYGVISYTVNRRTREIGIRMALGARAGDVMSLVHAQSLKLVLVGVVIGLGFAFAASRVMAGILYGVKPTDPLAFTGGAVLVVAISRLASHLPARRATRVDPMEALKYE